MKGQLTHWEKIFSNHISRIHREFSVQLSQTTANHLKKQKNKWAKI